MNAGMDRKRWNAVASALLLMSCGPAGLQRQDQFEWAISGAGSTSPPIVRVNLKDVPNGPERIRCLTSATLVYAIMKEESGTTTEGSWNRAVSMALASRDHSFRFARPQAWNVINQALRYEGSELGKGCALIERGKSAVWADIHGQVVQGPRFPRTGYTE